MKTLLLYEYPIKDWSVSIQGNLLHKGLLENGINSMSCYYMAPKKEKEVYYKAFKPDVVIGLGCWTDTPSIIKDPLESGLLTAPWLLADGWVANYHDIIGSLPLVFTTSQWVIDTYKRDGVKTDNFEVLHVGYDAKEFKPVSNPMIKRVRNMLGVKDDEKMILTIGGDVTSKGAQEVIKALAKIDKECPNYKYICIAGINECSEDHHQEETTLVKELGLDPDKILYMEREFHHDFMPYLLNACDIYAAPSRLEGFGMIQVEAMACGKPVISVDAMGPKDTIIHGKTGLLAKIGESINLEEEWVSREMGFEQKFKMKFDKPRALSFRADVDDIAEHTLKLLTDDDFRKEIGRNAAQHALDNFQYQNLAKKCVNLLKEKLGLY